MALILQGGAIFLHIPKTGGSWITKVLKECKLLDGKLGHKHADTAHLLSPIGNKRTRLISYHTKRVLGIYPKHPFLFCFVRHPLSWYESWFKYMSQPNQNWCHWGDEQDLTQWHPNSILNGLEDHDFNQFVRNVMKKRPGYVTEMFSWYTPPSINFTGKQENLVDDLVTVLNQLNLNFNEDQIRNTAPVNKSIYNKTTIRWDAEVKQKLIELEKIGITRYGYAPYYD